MKHLAALCLLLCSPAALAAAVPTIDQNLSFRSAVSTAISPDGKRVAYEVSKTNWEENAFETEIWVASVAEPHAPLLLTGGRKSSTTPVWSPDGGQLAFLSDREGKKQIYIIYPAGGEARQLSKSETAIANMRWMPDGKSLVYSAPDPESKEMKDRKEKYGEFDVVKADLTMNHLWMLPLEGAARQLTNGKDFSITAFSVSPDGTHVAFSAARDALAGSSGTSDIYVVAVPDGKPQKIVAAKGPDNNPIWSPDGSRIAYTTTNGAEFYFYANTRIAVVPMGGGTPKILSAGYDEDPSILAWNKAGIFFSGREKTASYLYKLDAGSGEFHRLGENDSYAYSAFSVTPDGSGTAFICATPSAYPEVYASATGPFRPVALTAMGEQLKDFTLAKREVISWKSKDGAVIEGVLLKPADFDPKKKYPLLVVIHGGPTGVDQAVVRPDRYYPVEEFVSKGALVLRPNYRGSAGYGEKFRELNVRNLGVGDSWDVLTGVDSLIAQGIVDPTRMGCMGWSQGGYISAFLTTSSDRFRAISVGAGISDWMTYYANTDITLFTPQYLKATPWDDPEIYKKTSPITYVGQAKTPTLIQHGELDKRVPIPNGYELRQALEDKGVPVKMVVYKGFGHGIDKPKQQRAVMEHNMEWFTKYIWP